jgi:hypothetical protein
VEEAGRTAVAAEATGGAAEATADERAAGSPAGDLRPRFSTGISRVGRRPSSQQAAAPPRKRNAKAEEAVLVAPLVGEPGRQLEAQGAAAPRRPIRKALPWTLFADMREWDKTSEQGQQVEAQPQVPREPAKRKRKPKAVQAAVEETRAERRTLP